MKYKIKIIIPYFGAFKNSIIPFFQSCENNPEFEWLIFTDNKVSHPYDNIEFKYCTLNDIKNRIEKMLGFSIALDAPYKLCDYRPAFGYIFQDELKGCDFWGWGDVDLVYGDLSKFINKELLSKYDKIFPCGHLSLLRNETEINRAFMLDIENTLDYKNVFTTSKSCIFDEYKGLNEKLIKMGKKVYGNIPFADMDMVYQRFRTADKNTLKVVFPQFLFAKNVPKNYRNQTFLVADGCAYRVFVSSKQKIVFQELAYIHYRHKILCKIEIKKDDEYFITNRGFLLKRGVVTKEVINDMNPYNGFLFEFKEYLGFCRERGIIWMGKNKRLRKIVKCIKKFHWKSRS